MRLKPKSVTLFCLSWLAFAPATKAQFLCNIVVPNSHGVRNHGFIANTFLAFGADRNYYTVASSEYDDTLASPSVPSSLRLIFQHSSDGGKTWERQDPGISIGATDYSFVRAIDVIDSLNVVAVGDSALVLRTTDGGEHWKRQNLPVYTHLVEVSFASPLEGMILGQDNSVGPFAIAYTTTDGGANWSVHPLPDNYVFTGKAYGHGKFRLFQSYWGTVYSTDDNFQSLDSTKPIFDTLVVDHRSMLLGACRFGSGDTIIAYGSAETADSIQYPDSARPIIWRSTDMGASWSQLPDIIDSNAPLGQLVAMTDIGRDTILGGFALGDNKILVSIDHGNHWKLDTLIFDTPTDAIVCTGLGLTPEGNLVGSFGGYFNSFLALGVPALAGIYAKAPDGYQANIYPNPTSRFVTIADAARNSIFHVVDILGREALRGTVPRGGSVTLDVSRLERGAYVVLLAHDGKLMPVGRFVLTAE